MPVTAGILMSLLVLVFALVSFAHCAVLLIEACLLILAGLSAR